MIGYCEEAKRRICALGPMVIAAFLDEIPPGQREKIYSPLRPVDGFRKDSKPELKERIKKFVQSITRPTDSKSKLPIKEWSVFSHIWVLWARRNFGPQMLFTSIDFTNATGDETVYFLKQLLESHKDVGCAREDVEKLMLFSGLPSSTEAQAVVNVLPNRKDLEKTQRINKIPEELECLRKAIDGWGAASKKIDTRFESITDQIEIIEQRGARDSKATSQILTDLDGIKEAFTKLDQMVERVHLMSVRAGEELLATANRLQSLENVDDTLKAVLERVSNLESENATKNMVEQNKTAVKVEKPWSELLEHRIKSQSNDFYRYSRHIEIDENVQLTLIKDASSALKILSDNFTAVGISKSSTDYIAPVVLAALAAGQLIQFTGSLSDILADATSRALGGKHIFEWRVPLGLCDSEDCSSILRMLNEDKAPNSIVIRGANKSAFEIYAQDLRNTIAKHQLGGCKATGLVPFIATLVNGPATFNENISLIELGPQIDSDQLKWGTPKPRQLKFGHFGDGSWESIFKSKFDIEEHDESQRIFKALKLPTNQLWAKVIFRASEELFRIPDSSFELTMQRLLNEWVIPSAKFQQIINDEFTGVLKKELRNIFDTLKLEVESEIAEVS